MGDTGDEAVGGMDESSDDDEGILNSTQQIDPRPLAGTYVHLLVHC